MRLDAIFKVKVFPLMVLDARDTFLPVVKFLMYIPEKLALDFMFLLKVMVTAEVRGTPKASFAGFVEVILGP